ncbi:MAG: hypothetical protein QM520_00360 [Gammaproteobacteria bacterium]|nr:hypothetical protein [Gammaproteobacteria bacterium]
MVQRAYHLGYKFLKKLVLLAYGRIILDIPSFLRTRFGILCILQSLS